jgi:hypothetical protein
MEEEFGVLIGEEQMGAVRCLADAAAMVGSSSESR